MADKRSDHPDERTLSARFERTFGRDHNGRSGLSIFIGETFSRVVGSDADALAGRAFMVAVAAVVGGGAFALATDLDIPNQPQRGGQFNLINGYTIVSVQNQQIALIRDKGDGQESYGVYINVKSHGDFADEWRLVADPEEAAAYAKLAGEYLQGTLDDGSYVAKNDSGGDVLGAKIFYAHEISVPYRNTGDDASTYVDMDAVWPQMEPAQFKSQVEQTRDFWVKAAQDITSGAARYGVEAPMQLTDDYYFWGQAQTGGIGLGLAAAVGLVGAAAIGGVGAARRRVVKPKR